MHPSTHLPSTDRPSRRDANRRVFWIAFAAGVGFIGALDATVFHHLLRWHNFYVHAGADWRAMGDGILHLFTTGLLFASVLLLWRDRHLISRGQADGVSLAAGVWMGMGAFQFVDGTLFHKILRLHPVREGVDDILLYDALWIGSSLVLLAIGWLLLRRGR